MKRLILTALDDNNKIWFENLIPFILSLRRTNYTGDVLRDPLIISPKRNHV